MDFPSVAELIRWMRIHRQKNYLTFREVAEKTGCDLNHFIGIETRRITNPRLDTLRDYLTGMGYGLRLVLRDELDGDRVYSRVRDVITHARKVRLSQGTLTRHSLESGLAKPRLTKLEHNRMRFPRWNTLDAYLRPLGLKLLFRVEKL